MYKVKQVKELKKLKKRRKTKMTQEGFILLVEAMMSKAYEDLNNPKYRDEAQAFIDEMKELYA